MLGTKAVFVLLQLKVAKGGLISEGILTLAPLPTKCAKSRPGVENLNKLFTY